MSEKRHQINKFVNYQNIIVRNSPAFDRHVFVSSQDRWSMDFDVMRMISTKSAGKTLADRFASCENIVWISFKRMYGKWLPPPWHTYCTSMLWSNDGCQNRVSADQYHLKKKNVCSILNLVYFDSWRWQSFVPTCDVFNCRFPLNVQKEIQLLSRVFCYSWLVYSLGFWLRNTSLWQSRKSDFGWHGKTVVEVSGDSGLTW